MNSSTHPPVAVQAVVIKLDRNGLHVLLSKTPQPDIWALPGMYMQRGETSPETLQRTLHTQASINVAEFGHTEQLYTFDMPHHAAQNILAVTYLSLCPTSTAPARAVFFPVHALPPLAEGHRAIVQYAQARLHHKCLYSTTISALLPAAFTLSELQNAYETILNQKLDKRNFRKRFLAMEVIAATGFHKKHASRPAQLYRFKRREPHTLPRSLVW